jgi:hypothetical protein
VRILRRELIVGIGAVAAVGAVSVLVPPSSASSTTVILETAARAVAVGGPGGGRPGGVETPAV